MVRVTFAGEALEGLTVDDPAASVRLLLPAGDGPPEVRWNGNEFLLPDGRRPTIRTLTPVRVDPEALELDLDVVLHGGGAASEWAEVVGPGDPAAISGPGRGYAVDRTAPAFLLAGDETALPAISQLLAALPPGTPARVHVEVAQPDARLELSGGAGITVEWHDLPPGTPPGDALVAAVAATDLMPGTHIWAAGEAAAMQRVRRLLFEDRGIPRAEATVRGYWKNGRSAGAAGDG